jgi:hypothetical protein
MRQWINHNNGNEGRRSRHKRVEILQAMFTDDSEATSNAIKDDIGIIDIVDTATTHLIQGICAEFEKLRQSSTFGRWDTEKDVKGVSKLSTAGKVLAEHAPLFTNLMTELACDTRSGGYQGHSRQEEEGYLVSSTSLIEVV